MQAFWNRISIGWCRTFHPEPSWPIHGHYHCSACLRMYPVPWHEGKDFAERQRTDPSGRGRGFMVFSIEKDRG